MIYTIFIIIFIIYCITYFGNYEHFRVVGYNDINIPNYKIKNKINTESSKLELILYKNSLEHNLNTSLFTPYNKYLPFPYTDIFISIISQKISEILNAKVTVNYITNIYYNNILNDRIYIFQIVLYYNLVNRLINIKLKITNINTDYFNSLNNNNLINQFIYNNTTILDISIDKSMITDFSITGTDSLNTNFYNINNSLHLLDPFLTSYKNNGTYITNTMYNNFKTEIELKKTQTTNYKEEFNNTYLNGCIYMYCTNNIIQTYAKYTININKNYAKKHNYDFILDTIPYDSTVTHAWQKIQGILKLVTTNKYKFIMYIDADAFFNNQDITIESILNKYHNDFIICSDKENSNGLYEVNAGVFIVKNTDNIKTLLNQWWNLRYVYPTFAYEQHALSDIIKNKYSNINKSIISIAPSTEFNSIYSEILQYIDNKNKLSNRFIIHLMATSDKIREKILSSISIY